ncbi:MAG: response regulator [Burkholderiaceae bacterium]
MSSPATPHEALTILFVDDEPQARKWVARLLADEFTILTADGVDEALALLREHERDIAVLVTDYRMPQRNGMELLQAAQREHRHLVRLLATAYAEKEVAIAAVNQGQVFRILEKPLDEMQTRAALREALALHRRQAQERALHESRVLAMRETLGFLAHELNTPLTTIRGYMTGLKDRYQPAPASGEGRAIFSERRPGEVMAALEAAERRALYCQSLVSTFVQSARDAYPGAVAPTVSAGSLVKALLDEFPFEGEERSWVSSRLGEDFLLPGRRDLLYLVLCTLTKNALLALKGQAQPSLQIVLGRDAPAEGPAKPWMRFIDNGHGIAPDILAKLTREPVTTRAHSGGNGMGLMFCRRVVQSISGAIEIASELGRGTSVSLYFQPLNEAALGTDRV